MKRIVGIVELLVPDALRLRAEKIHKERLMEGPPCDSCWVLAAASIVREAHGQVQGHTPHTDFAYHGPEDAAR